MATDKLRLFALGFLTLFLELCLIRFLAGTVWNLGYFPNLVLLSVFVGMGLGFMFHYLIPERASPWVVQGGPGLLLLLVAMVVIEHPSVPGFGGWSGLIGGELYFTAADVGVKNSGSDVAFFLSLFVILAALFACISQYTAKLFRLFPPLLAYTLDIGGSCAGILSFIAISFLGLSPYLWFIFLMPLFLLALLPTRLRYLPLLPLLGVALLAAYQDTVLLQVPDYSGPLDVHWSPYQRIEFLNFTPKDSPIFANGLGHQTMHPAENLDRAQYRAPYDWRKGRPGSAPYKSVLIMGAGSGNDVAAALRNGAEHVDAVEIDPVIARLGRAHHPLQPYSDPRVTLTIDDARAFMTRTTRRYDLIIFALTDSVVKVSSMSQLRLENYLFTRESVARAYQLLNDHGDVVLYNYYRTPWLFSKLARMSYEATGKYPRQIYRKDDLGALAVSRDLASEPPPPDMQATDFPTDDWPFLYLQSRGIPRMYAVAMACVGGVIAGLMALLQFLKRRAEGEASLTDRLAFLLMGLSFLLLETKSIVQFSLLFGTTWLNSSLVFLAVLALVLVANWTAVLIPRGRLIYAAYALLLLSCLITLWYPLANLLHLHSALLRFVLASLMTFLPIFFANLIFSVTFRDQAVPEQVFGWNLIGATMGGIVEYTSMALGYSALSLLVAVCYAVVLGLSLIGARQRAAASPVA